MKKKFSFKICIWSEFCQFVRTTMLNLNCNSAWRVVVVVAVRLAEHISANFNNDDDNYKWIILFAWASLSYYIQTEAAEKLNHGRTHTYTLQAHCTHKSEFSWLKADSNIQMTIIAHTKHTHRAVTAHCTNVWIFSASYLSLIVVVVVVVIQCMYE